MDELLLILARKKAHVSAVRITTSELGLELGMSQQNASRRLALLENEGKISRSNSGISLTEKGMREAQSLYSELKSAFETGKAALSGTIISGLGEGKYYMSFPEYKKQIKEKLGFEPYEGTLNIRLTPESAVEKARLLKTSEPVRISGFRKGERTFGDLYAYPCTVEKAECAIIIPLRTHHPAEIIEVIAPENLKKLLGKKDGEQVSISL